MSYNDYFGGWTKVIDKNLLEQALNKVRKFPNSLSPHYEDIFRAFHLCDYNNLKVVMIGQDPYPQKDIATGVMFGNNKLPMSPSLEVIWDSLGNPEGFDITLESWTRQGVLLLNSSLTVKINNPNSHSLIWRKFTETLLKNLSKRETGIIYVLFGNVAQSFEYCIGPFNQILKEKHPAWYSRQGIVMPDKVFREINSLLYSKYGETIKWYEQKDKRSNP